jgi:hypothetical protein
VCIGVVPAANGAEGSGGGTVGNITPVTEKKFLHVTGRSIVLRLNFSARMDHEEEDCAMHQGNKIGSSAVGDLVWTKQKQTVNPFEACHIVVKQAKAICSKI